LGKGTISQLAWSQFGTIIAVGGSEGIRLYTADTLEEIRFIPTDYLITTIAFSPDGTLFATGSADIAFSSRTSWRRSTPIRSDNNFVQLWDVETGRLLETIDTGSNYVTTVAFSPDGTLLASGGMYPDENAIRLWKLDSVFEGNDTPWKTQNQHTRSVFSIDFSPNGETLLSGSGDNTVRAWDVTGDRPASTLMYRAGAIVQIYAVDYSPATADDGEQLVAIAGSVFQGSTPTELLEIWDATSREMVHQLQGHTSSVDSVAFSPDGKILASGGSYPDNNIHIWDAQSGEQLRVLEGHVSGVRNLAFSPDGETLASSGWDATIYLWDVETGEVKGFNDEHTSVVWSSALSPDGNMLATGGDEGFIRLWDMETGQKLKTLNANSSRVTSLAFNSDGMILIAGTDEPNFAVQLWDVNSGELLNQFEGHQNFVQVLALSPDGKTLASGGALGDNTVRLWDISKSRPALHAIEGHRRSVKSLAFREDGQVLASGDGTGTIRLIEVASGQVQGIIQGQDCAINALVFEPENGHLVAGGCEGILRVWDIQTGEMIHELKGIDETVTKLAYDGDNQALVIAYLDGSIWFRDLTLGTLFSKIERDGVYFQTFHFQPDGILVAVDYGGGMLRLWNIQP
jgi:WD40 repeat protein